MTDTKFTYRHLIGDEGLPFENMTYPAYRHLLPLRPTVRMPRELDEEPFDPLAVGAFDGEEPIGLALGGTAPDTEEVELVSLFVVKAHRRKGVARDLVRAFEQVARHSERPVLSAVYMTGRPGSDVFEHIASSLGWSEPETRMVSVRFSTESLAKAPWMGRYKLGADWEIFPWAELTDAERERIRTTNEESEWIKPDLVPWKFDKHGFDTATSLGARHKGEVVGWVINHRIADDTVRYTCSFMRQPWGRMGKIVPLYSESFSRFLRSGATWATFTTPLRHKGMVGFAKKWFGPWSTYLGESRGVRKALNE